MLRTTFRSLWSHKRRLVSTCVAIVLGVAFMSGTFVLNGTVGKIFDDLFADIGKGIDAQVRGPELFDSRDMGGGTVRGPLPDSVVEEIRALPGVAAAEGSVLSLDATVIDAKGDAMGGIGPPVMVGSWDADPQLSPYQIVEGRAPEADGEAVIDMGGLDKGGFELGDQVRIVTGTQDLKLRLVGAARFGDADSAGGSLFVGTTLAQAQAIAEKPGKVDTVSVRGEAGVTPQQLVERLRDAKLDPGADIVTGKQASDEQASDIKQAFSFFTTMLLIFALIALFVGWFIISNTFSILVAQRTRELALLRAIGATRRQVMGSVLTEAVVVGLTSGIIGFGAGVALAWLGFEGLRSAGLDLPSAGLTIPPSAIINSILAGLLVTIVAAIMPAIRATRVPPIAALRDVAIDTSGASRFRAFGGLAVLLVGAYLTTTAFTDHPTNDDVRTVGIGAGLILLAILVLGPVLATPLSRALGSWIPKLKGVTGTIARQNAMRSPRRTASTASALVIGVTLIVFITVFAQSATTSMDKAIGSSFDGDYIVMPVNQMGTGGAPPEVLTKIQAVDGVRAATPRRVTLAEARFGAGDRALDYPSGIDPATVGEVFDFSMTQGAIRDLHDGGAVVSDAVAREKGLSIGDPVTFVSTAGEEVKTRIVALTNDVLLGNWVLTTSDLQKLNPAAGVVMIGIDLEPGVSVESVRAPLRTAIDEYPQLKLQDREQFKSGIISQITQILFVIYVLLGVSIVISLIGIANTLSLSIHERTRELGLLRAMGMTRAQMRSSVRWEAVIVALIGTLLGMGLGIGLSWLMVKALRAQGITHFSAPPVWMMTTALIAAGLAVFASLFPARRASRLNMLEAIATE